MKEFIVEAEVTHKQYYRVVAENEDEAVNIWVANKDHINSKEGDKIPISLIPHIIPKCAITTKKFHSLDYFTPGLIIKTTIVNDDVNSIKPENTICYLNQTISELAKTELGIDVNLDYLLNDENDIENDILPLLNNPLFITPGPKLGLVETDIIFLRIPHTTATLEDALTEALDYIKESFVVQSL